MKMQEVDTLTYMSENAAKARDTLLLRGYQLVQSTLSHSRYRYKYHKPVMQLHMTFQVSARKLDTQLLPLLPLNKVQRFLGRYAVDGAVLVPESNTVALVCHPDNLRTESCADELRSSVFGDLLQQTGNSGTVLRVQVGIHLVEDNHGTGLGGLDGEDEA